MKPVRRVNSSDQIVKEGMYKACRLKIAVVGCALLVMLFAPRALDAYSVLAHEAIVDALWNSDIRPLLIARFPNATSQQLEGARAYAYGGCVIQDSGYYPFGSHLFSNLVHYVRSGDFVETMIQDSQDVNEYAFALGALSHYAADNTGHPLAVNLSVPIMYPKLRAKYGNEVTYADSPKDHVMVEFSFDVVQIAGGAYRSQNFHDFIGFQVAKPLLERAFHETYGLEMSDIFFDEDLAIGTYRHAVSKTLPGMTTVAWRKKRDAIEKVAPGIRKSDFVFHWRRGQYRKEFGKNYREPGGLARVIEILYDILPKIGPLSTFQFKTPTPQTEQLFLQSFVNARERYAETLKAVGDKQLNLPDVDLDTGKSTQLGEYSLADETYADLLDKLADKKFAAVLPELRRNLLTFFGNPHSLPNQTEQQRKRSDKTQREMDSLRAACAANCS
jgi:hypothetical protein